MATISTHNGPSVSRGHNLRKEEIVSKESHIDPNGIHETWCDIAPRQAYEQLFGQAVDLYNAKQTRADRKITNYYNEVRDDQRRHVVYEMIIGIYPKEGEYITDETEKAIMQEFVSSWSERNPNLALIGAYYHADEQGQAPHVHIDYIPVAHGYKRGPAIQNGLVKALGEMGFEKSGKLTAQIQWGKRENEFLEQLCNNHRITVEHPQAGKGVNHVNTQLYKAQQDLNALLKDQSRLSTEVLELHSEISHLQETRNSIGRNIDVLLSEQHRQRSSVEFLKKLENAKKHQIEQLQETYAKVESMPPIRKEVEIPVKRYVDVPVERVVEVEKEVLVEKEVEVELNYKTMAEKAIRAFKAQSDWIDNKGFSSESYNDLCHDMDYLQMIKTIYPRNRARVEPLHPDQDPDVASSLSHGR